MKTKVISPVSLLVLAAAVCGCACPHKAPSAPPPTSSTTAAARGEPAQAATKTEAKAVSGEGMWPWASLGSLDAAALRQRGLKVPERDLWQDGKGGLLSAVAGLKGCSASFVSVDGLVLTNHHCAFEAVQRNATPERNLVEQGFFARTRKEELDGHGLKLQVFVSQTDVTAQVLKGLPTSATDHERIRHIEAREKALIKECEEKPSRRCSVARYNDGLAFVLLENLELKDVRLVAVPPRALGDFGGSIDNWRWPRHTMDFTLLRAYVAKDGTPADYNPANVPYQPARHLRIATTGVKDGAFVMIAGTPGRTARYRTLSEARDDAEWLYPARRDLFGAWLGLLDETCKRLPETCLPTATQAKTLDNSYINALGMVEGLRRVDLVGRKEREEAAWRAWVASDVQRQLRYGGALDALDAYQVKSRVGRERDLLVRYLLWGVRGLGFGRTITRWAAEQRRPDAERDPGFQERDRALLRRDLQEAQRSLHVEADKAVLSLLLGRFGALPQEEHLAALDTLTGGDTSAASLKRTVDRLYKGSRLLEQAERERLFEQSFDTLQASKDSLVRLALALKPELDAYDERRKTSDGALSRLRPPYIESLAAMRGQLFYPDANGTPRLAFAHVGGYAPRDALVATPFTTLKGLLAKNTGKSPFDVPLPIRDAAGGASASPYADAMLGDVPIDFLANADTTGGNSGSPALDGQGRLVGLNFDRVYESIAGDYVYDPAMQRNIMVDMRAILWYLDAVLGADALLTELKVR